MRILLIEDDLNFCETLRFQLEQEAYEVDVCHDGRDGLDLFLQDAHDIVLLDRMLPTMNGLLVLQKARQAGISTPVILITALGELYDRIEGLDAGADDYIVKPFAFEELTARIRSLGRRSGKWEDDNLLTICDISYDCNARLLSGPTGSIRSPAVRADCWKFFCGVLSSSSAVKFFLSVSGAWMPKWRIVTSILTSIICASGSPTLEARLP